MSTDQPEPVVTVDPRMRFGQPHIKGVSTDAIVGMYLAGESAEVVCDEYGVTRHELLLALWFEGEHVRARRQELGWWARNVAYPVLSGFDKSKSIDEIELPEVTNG